MAMFVIGVSVFWFMICPPEPWAYATGIAGLALGAALLHIQDKRSQ